MRQVVTASGIIVKASPQHFPDLFWALRGGGNNMGIVTGFELQTHPLKDDLLFGGTRIFLVESTNVIYVTNAGALINFFRPGLNRKIRFKYLFFCFEILAHLKGSSNSKIQILPLF